MKELYEQYISEESHRSPLQYDKMTKLNAPLYYVEDPSLINPKYLDDYRKALLYVGKCFNEVPKNKHAIHTNAFNCSEIVYKTREFGYIPKPMQFSMRKIVDMAFSASSFRTMCIKAEIAVFLYYTMMSKCVDLEYKDYPEDLKFVMGAFTYAITRHVEGYNQIREMAVYVWELATFINVLADLSEETEEKFALPCHHVFQSTRRYGSIANFGDYNWNKLDDDFFIHLTKIPKRATDISYDDHPMFYIPSDSDVKDICTDTFDKIMNDIRELKLDMTAMAKELCKITEYENEFLLAKGEAYAEGCSYYFNSEEEAKEFMRKVKIPEGFDTSNLYFSLMIQDGDKQDLKLFKYK